MGLEIRLDQLDALALGDRGAGVEELAALDELGYVVVPAVLPADQVAELVEEFERLVAADPRARLHELGTRRAKSDNDNEVLAVCWRHRVALEAAVHILGERFEVGHGDLRDANPGYGDQRYHPDHGAVPVPGLTVTWFLDRFSADNGATTILPGSHRTHRSVAGAAGDGSVPGEIVAIGPAGSVLLRDARLYHRGGRNATMCSRRSILVFYQHHIDAAPSDA